LREKPTRKESAYEPPVYAWKFALAAAATFARSSTMYMVLGLGAIPSPTVGVLDIICDGECVLVLTISRPRTRVSR
jgi:hypothetical protein